MQFWRESCLPSTLLKFTIANVRSPDLKHRSRSSKSLSTDNNDQWRCLEHCFRSQLWQLPMTAAPRVEGAHEFCPTCTALLHLYLQQQRGVPGAERLHFLSSFHSVDFTLVLLLLHSSPNAATRDSSVVICSFPDRGLRDWCGQTILGCLTTWILVRGKQTYL